MPRGLEKARIDIPAKAEQVLSADRRIPRSAGLSRGVVRRFELLGCMSGLLRSRHQLESRLLERKLARAVRKPVKQGLRIDADIGRRREHTGVPGHSAHAPRRRVMHGAAKQATIIRVLARIGSVFLVKSTTSVSTARPTAAS